MAWAYQIKSLNLAGDQRINDFDCTKKYNVLTYSRFLKYKNIKLCAEIYKEDVTNWGGVV